MTILDNIPFQIDTDSLLKKLHLEKASKYGEELISLARSAQTIGKPKAAYRVAYIESRGDDYVIVEGITLTSRLLRINLEQTYRVFPYLATCGMELEDWANSIEDALCRFWAETIKETALGAATRILQAHIAEHCHPGLTSTMSPGSLAYWPIEEQRALFTILGNAQNSIGVKLTDSLLMVPTKSVSGIRFPTEESFESCQLCPREKCPGRKVPYDKDLYERKYGK